MSNYFAVHLTYIQPYLPIILWRKKKKAYCQMKKSVSLSQKIYILRNSKDGFQTKGDQFYMEGAQKNGRQRKP